ncbi:MAG: sulfatase-like hydrolase/transferase [Planctomycetota bacterium]|jgi:arylsulfatase A-like enzyme
MASRPNVLFIMTDHTNAEAVAPGSPCLTPNLDRLAQGGARFARCHTPNAICSPARASLMTGLYPSMHGMWDCTHTQRREWVDVPADRFRYFSMDLAKAGYSTAYFGKWHVEQSGRLEDFGWREYDTKCSSRRPEGLVPGSEVVVETPGYRPQRLAGVADDEGSPAHPAFERGVEFLRGHARSGSEAPFCLFVSTGEPHDAYFPPRSFFERYDLSEVPLSPSHHDECLDKPEVVRRMRRVWAGMSDNEWRRTRAAYWALVSWLDSEVGRILGVLKETGLDDDTIVVFTSDHGDMLGSHGLATKGVGTAYEEVYNIPLVMKAPGMAPRGEVAGARVSLVDLAPTLLDLCAVAPLPDAQGRSFRGLLDGTGNPADWQDAYAEFFGQRFVYTQRITWHGDRKYVFSPGGCDELYDLAADPHERTNLADEPAYRDALLDMTRRMWRKMKEIGDESLFRTHYATLRTAPIGPTSIEE